MWSCCCIHVHRNGDANLVLFISVSYCPLKTEAPRQATAQQTMWKETQTGPEGEERCVHTIEPQTRKKKEIRKVTTGSQIAHCGLTVEWNVAQPGTPGNGRLLRGSRFDAFRFSVTRWVEWKGNIFFLFHFLTLPDHLARKSRICFAFFIQKEKRRQRGIAFNSLRGMGAQIEKRLKAHICPQLLAHQL